jgi:hypothetical protein
MFSSTHSAFKIAIGCRIALERDLSYLKKCTDTTVSDLWSRCSPLTQLNTDSTRKFLTKKKNQFSLTSQEVRTIFAHVKNNKITDDETETT